MTRTDRLTAILDILARTGQVEVEEIVSQLGVSPATARRDLDSLANRRLLTRTRGGATIGSLAYDLPGRYNRDDHAEAKEQIAQAASALIWPGAVIGPGCFGTDLAGRRDRALRRDHQYRTGADPGNPGRPQCPREPAHADGGHQRH